MATDGEKEVAEAHMFPFNPNRRLITWGRLECQRLKRLGIANRYSRHFNMLNESVDNQNARSTSGSGTGSSGTGQTVVIKIDSQNSMAPFSTVGKPTCGYYFSRVTDNKKKKFGIPPSNLVRWRSQTAAPTQQ